MQDVNLENQVVSKNKYDVLSKNELKKKKLKKQN